MFPNKKLLVQLISNEKGRVPALAITGNRQQAKLPPFCSKKDMKTAGTQFSKAPQEIAMALPLGCIAELSLALEKR